MTNFTILLADDTPDYRESIANYLRLQPGVIVEEVNDGQEALESLNSKPFDLLITDLQMPYLDGIELFEAARLAGHHLPVILCTGSLSGVELAELHGIESVVKDSRLGEYLLTRIGELKTLPAPKEL